MNKNYRLAAFYLVALITCGAIFGCIIVGFAAIPNNTIRQNAGVVMPTVNATGAGYFVGPDMIVSAARAASFVTLDTGQGANELYPMDQAVRTIDDVQFHSIDIQELNLNSVDVTDVLAYPVTEASYIVWADNSTGTPIYYAKNGISGVVEFSGSNSSAIIQYAVTNCPQHGRIVLIGSFMPDTRIILKSDMVLDLSQAIIYWNELDSLIYCAGSLGASSLLTIDAGIGSTSITVADSSAFSINGYLLIGDDIITDGRVSKNGEYHEISNIVGNVITIVGVLRENYSLLQNAVAKVWNPITNVHVEGGKIIGQYVDGVFGIWFQDAVKFTIKGVTIEKVRNRAISIVNTLEGEVSNNWIYQSDQAANGYGISLINFNYDVLITKNQIYNCRHAVSHGVSSSYGGYGYSSGIIFSENMFTGSVENQFDVHEGAADEIFIINNKFTTISSGSIGTGAKRTYIIGNEFHLAGSSGAVSDRGNYVEELVIIDNIVVGTGNAVFLDSTDLKKVYVSNLYAQNIGSYSCYVVGNSDTWIHLNNIHSTGPDMIPGTNRIRIVTAKTVLITNCVLGESERSGIYLDNVNGGIIDGNEVFNSNQQASSTISYSCGIYLNNCQNFVITNNRVYDNQITPTQRRGIYEAGTCDYNIITNNRVFNNTINQIVFVGVNNKVGDNLGFVTENMGTGTILNGSTSIVINHGLGYTPTSGNTAWTVSYLENPTNDPGSWYIDTFTATQATIHVFRDPGISHLDIAWSARRTP